MDRLNRIVVVGAVVLASMFIQGQTIAPVDASTSVEVLVQADEAHAQASGGTTTYASTETGRINAGLASGTTFNATLNSPIDSKKNKPGDAVAAHTSENVMYEGRTVLPRGTKLIGHVTQASAGVRGGSESAVGIVFDRAVLKSGQEVPLNVAIQAIGSAQAASALDTDVDTMGSMDTGAVGPSMSGGRGAVGGLTSTAGGAAVVRSLVPPLRLVDQEIQRSPLL